MCIRDRISTDTITSTDATLGITFAAKGNHTKSAKGDMQAIQYFAHGMDSGNASGLGGY